MNRPPTAEYLELMKQFEPRIAELALAVRTMILEEAPEAEEVPVEAVNAVALGYTYTGRPRDVFAHVAAYATWVSLGFPKGSEIPDPGCILRGDGRWIRYIRISSINDAERGFVRRFIQEAAKRGNRILTETEPEEAKPEKKKKRRPGQR